jgi:hypothetical protein
MAETRWWGSTYSHEKILCRLSICNWFRWNSWSNIFMGSNPTMESVLANILFKFLKINFVWHFFILRNSQRNFGTCFWKFYFLWCITSIYILGDSKWLWPGVAAMYEGLCGSCVDEVELSFVWHFISVHLIFFYIITHWFDSFQNCETMNCQRNINCVDEMELSFV